VLENQCYLNGNYRGALLEHFQQSFIMAKLSYATQEDLSEGARVFISTCRADGGKYEEGIGYATSKKAAIHYASLDFMLKMKLLTMEEHLERHPDI